MLRKDVTRLLHELEAGHPDVLGQLIPLIYAELRRLAASYLKRERPGHTLQPTALVHEAYVRLVDQRQMQWQNRAHFFGIAAQTMRRILVDHARAHDAVKRGRDQQAVPLDEALVVALPGVEDVVALDEVLTRLAAQDAQQAQIVELRVFAGLTIAEAAEVLGISTATVKRDWNMAKAWLRRELPLSRDQNQKT